MNIIRNLEETLKKPPRELAYAYPLILPTYSVMCIRYVYPPTYRTSAIAICGSAQTTLKT